MMATGSISAPEAVDMVVEKATTFTEAAGVATTALGAGRGSGRGRNRGAGALRRTDRSERSRTARLNRRPTRGEPPTSGCLLR